jgi:hypothetical protein
MIDIKTKQLFYDCFDFIKNSINCQDEINNWLHNFDKIDNNKNKKNNKVLTVFNNSLKKSTFIYVLISFCIFILILLLFIYVLIITIKLIILRRRRQEYTIIV